MIKDIEILEQVYIYFWTWRFNLDLFKNVKDLFLSLRTLTSLLPVQNCHIADKSGGFRSL